MGSYSGTSTASNIQPVESDARFRVDRLRRPELHPQRDFTLQTDDDVIVGGSAVVAQLRAIITKVANADATSVLITGETGTGKELVARAIHRRSRRASGPFVAVNCAALCDTLADAELFGHERGAFTGALEQRRGKLEAANGGTVFLDEIGELGPAHQSKLLRALQQREVDRVGGTRPVPLNVRVIAATNRDLKADVSAGRFRLDLFHRLNVVEVRVPALRDRRQDIPLLAAHFLRRFAPAAQRGLSGISVAALDLLTAFDWPGNVRELQNVMERAAVLGTAEEITPDDLPTAVSTPPQENFDAPERFHDAVRRVKQRVIVNALAATNGRYTEAARRLGIHPNYLHRLIKQLGVKSQIQRGLRHVDARGCSVHPVQAG